MNDQLLEMRELLAAALGAMTVEMQSALPDGWAERAREAIRTAANAPAKEQP